MKSVKIAVIDSGYSYTLFSDVKNVVLEEDFQIAPFKGNLESLREDDLGHGSMCIRTIIEYIQPVFDNYIIYPIKIFNDSGTTSSKRLLEALKNLIGRDIDIINISLSTVNQEIRDDLRKICSILESENKVIISSKSRKYDPEEKLSLPACLESVIGVGGDNCLEDDSFYINYHSDIQLVFDSKTYIVKSIFGLDSFGSTSRATSIATAKIAEILLSRCKLPFSKSEIISILASDIRQKTPRKTNEDRVLKVTDIAMMRKIYEILCEMGLSVSYSEMITGNTLKMCLQKNTEIMLIFIENIEKTFNIKISIHDYPVEYLCDIFYMIDIIKKEKGIDGNSKVKKY